MKTTKPEHWTDEEWKDAMRKVIELGYKKNAHWKAFYICDKWDKFIGLPLVLVSSILSTLSISQTASSSDTQSVVTSYLITASSLFVTGLTTVGKFYNFAELKEGHRQACFNYLRLRAELILQLNVPDIVYADFMKTYHTKWLNIRENSPNLPMTVVAEMTEKTNQIEQDYLLNALHGSNGANQHSSESPRSDEQQPIDHRYQPPHVRVNIDESAMFKRKP